MTGQKLLLVLAIFLTTALAAQALPIDLYANPDANVGLQGPSGVGKARNQVFSPTQSSVLYGGGSSAVLSGPGQTAFDSVSMHFQVNTAGESATVALRLYSVSGSIGSTLTAITNGSATPIAQTGNTVLSGVTDQWITLNLPTPQAATGQYVASMKHVEFTGSVGMESRGTYWVTGTRTADGKNDGYTGTTFNNNRLYSVRLGAVPEPASFLAMLGGLVFVVRRRR